MLIKLNNNGEIIKYPYSWVDFFKENPNTGFPDNVTSSSFSLSPWNVFRITYTPKPVFDVLTQTVKEGIPAKIGDVWTQTWVVENIPQSISVENIKNSIIVSTQTRLDDFAKTRNYDNILSACTYATSAVPKFASEGQTCVNLRDSTWIALYTIFEQVIAATRPMPTSFEDIVGDLPPLVWGD